MEQKRLILKRIPLRALRIGAVDADPLQAAAAVCASSVRKWITQGVEPEPGTFDVLDFVPTAVGHWTNQTICDDRVLRELADFPAAAMCALSKASTNPATYGRLSSILDPAIAGDGELLTMFIGWLPKARLAVNPLRYRSAMLTHPIHGIRWARAIGDEQFAFDLLEWAHAHLHEFGGAGWTVLVSQQEDPESFRSILSLDPLYMAASAVTYGMKFDVEEFPDDIDGRAIYTLLRNDACFDKAAAEKKLMRTDPFWALEWLLHSGRYALPELFEPAIRTLADHATLKKGNPLYLALRHTWAAIEEEATAKRNSSESKKPDGNRSPLDAELDEDEEGSAYNSSRPDREKPEDSEKGED